MDHKTVKVLSGATLAFFLDKYLIGETDSLKSAKYAGAVGGALYASEYLVAGIDALPIHIPTLSKSLYDGKTLTSRAVEVALTTASSNLVNNKVLKNVAGQSVTEFYFRLGMSALIDVGAEYIADYVTNQPLEAFTDDQ